jgi:hypothetical protein
MYENPVLYVNSVALAVFHIFAFIIFLIMEKCFSCTQETRYILNGGNCVALCKVLCICRYIKDFMVYFKTLSISEK